MRYLKLVLSPSDGTFHPVEEMIADNPDIHRGQVHHINLLSDDTVAALYEIEGDGGVLRDALAESDEILSYDVIDVSDGTHHVYVHVSQGEPVVGLLSIVDDRRLMVDTPMEFVDDGVRATVIGEQETLREALDDIPDGVTVDVRRVGEYSPQDDRVLSNLTDRQREVLRVAARLGYYDVPRSATHDEVAEALGCAPSTASEHLRKIESKIVGVLVD
jgi:predicted DNA binding protein